MKEEHILRLFGKRVLRRILGPEVIKRNRNHEKTAKSRLMRWPDM
jgi:hypothetical protein